MNVANVAGVLEVVATEQPHLLRPLVKALEYGRAAAGVADLAERWRIGPESHRQACRRDHRQDVSRP